ncbi:MAG: hypothetical protein ACO3E4_07905, partial [Candidatus Nanopelagicaceae bacterium]
ALNTYIGGLANSLAGLNVDFSDSGNRAATGWANATVALQTYLRELYNSQNPNTPSTDPIDPQFPWPDPNIRPFAMGGIVKKATIGLVGEAGPEAIIPLSKMPEVFEPSGGGMNVYVTVQGSVISEGDLIEQVRQGLLDIQVDGGAVLVNSRTL